MAKQITIWLEKEMKEMEQEIHKLNKKNEKSATLDGN